MNLARLKDRKITEVIFLSFKCVKFIYLRSAMNTLNHRISRLAWNRHTVSCVILACVSWPLHAATSAVSAGSDHSVALTCEGNVLTWGSNINGQLGDGTLNRRTVPGLVANFNGAVAISAGSEHTLALQSDGTVG